MPELNENQRKVFNFLREHLQTQEPFTREELTEIIGEDWRKSTTDTYFPKLYAPLLVDIGNDFYRVSEAFRKYATEEKFSRFVSQTRKVRTDYRKDIYENVIIFEFFMPLTNESSLKWSLDTLFYKDAILTRLKKQIELSKLEKYFPRKSEELENEDQYYENICNWISKRFGGYSISHVEGRFKTGNIKTLTEAAEMQSRGEQYLIDETTAVVKFIFPCGKPIEKSGPNLFQFIEELKKQKEEKEKKDLDKEADCIRWLFNILFVCNIVELVDGEDEIWMLESGLRSRLNIWRRSD